MAEKVKWISLILGAMLIVLLIRLFYGNGSIVDVFTLKKEVAGQQETINKLTERNEMLAAEVQDLKYHLQALEERARTDLGMVKKGETFYQFSQKEQQP